MTEAVVQEVRLRQATNLHRLTDLVRLQSVSSPVGDPQVMRESAVAVRELLLEIGLENVAILDVGDSHPYVFAELSAGPDRPTCLLYAHHDVQPVGESGDWTSDPFLAVERDGRLYGRGTADDKGGLIVHVSAIEAWLRTGCTIPVNLKLLIDGEEEIGSPHLPSLLAREGNRLRSDIVVIPDSMNWEQGEPALTSSLRGVVSVVIEVRALRRSVHSGIWGGATPDPLIALCRVLSSLVDQHGSLVTSIIPQKRGAEQTNNARREHLSAADENELRNRVGLHPGVDFIGDPEISLLDRLWEGPSVTVIGIDAPRVVGASNSIQPIGRARISLRLPPDEDPQTVRQRLQEHIKEHVPWGLECTVSPFSAERGWRAPSDSPTVAAAFSSLEKGYGRPATAIGMGGSVPAVAMLRRAFGDVEFLLTGIEDHKSHTHGIDESLNLDDWRNACIAESLLFSELAAVPVATATNDDRGGSW